MEHGVLTLCGYFEGMGNRKLPWTRVAARGARASGPPTATRPSASPPWARPTTPSPRSRSSARRPAASARSCSSPTTAPTGRRPSAPTSCSPSTSSRRAGEMNVDRDDSIAWVGRQQRAVLRRDAAGHPRGDRQVQGPIRESPDHLTSAVREDSRMGIELRTATPDDVGPMFQADARAFGFTLHRRADPAGPADDGPDPVPPRVRRAAASLESPASFGFDVTLPGGAAVPAGGVTWVSVQPTHRRQGLLRRLMDACHADIDARGEPVAMLNAERRRDLRAFRLRDRRHRAAGDDQPEGRNVPARGGAVRRHGRGQPSTTRSNATAPRCGSASGGCERARSAVPTRGTPSSPLAAARSPRGCPEAFHLRHAEGFVSYRVAQDWNEGQPQHKVEIVEMVACTPDAHAALWHTVLGLDLVGVVRTRQMPLDDPLPYLLQNARVVVSSGVDDNTWVHPRDVATCFGTRTYGSDDRLVVEAAGRRWAIDGSPEGASCKPVRTRPDLATDVAGLGVLLLGGVRPSVLAAGRRLDAQDQRTLRRADARSSSATTSPSARPTSDPASRRPVPRAKRAARRHRERLPRARTDERRRRRSPQVRSAGCNSGSSSSPNRAPPTTNCWPSPCSPRSSASTRSSAPTTT